MADELTRSYYGNAVQRVSKIHYAPRRRSTLSLITATIGGTSACPPGLQSDESDSSAIRRWAFSGPAAPIQSATELYSSAIDGAAHPGTSAITAAGRGS